MIKKRGLSTVVVTLIMIIIALGAVTVIWFIVRDIIGEGSEQASGSFGLLSINLEIQKVLVEENGSVSISVKRNAGEGNLAGIKFIVRDGINSEVIERKDINLDELEERKFTLNQSELGEVAFVKEVSIAPIFESESGKETIGNIVDSFEKTSIGLDTLEEYGLISWWRLNGDATDSFGENDGTPEGSASVISGKYGNAYNFPGTDTSSRIKLKSASMDGLDDFSIALWLKKDTSGFESVISGANSGQNNEFLIFPAGTSLQVYLQGVSDSWTISDLTDGSWHYMVFTRSGTTGTVYQNGDSKGTNSVSTTALSIDTGGLFLAQEQDSVGGGFDSNQALDGAIDEVMIFNKALTEKQIEALYELDLE